MCGCGGVRKRSYLGENKSVTGWMSGLFNCKGGWREGEREREKEREREREEVRRGRGNGYDKRRGGVKKG